MIHVVCFSQITTRYISPVDVDINYDPDDAAHGVVKNTASPNNKLFLFIGGSFSVPFIYQGISNFAGNEEFDVINISYPNSVAAATLSNSSDSLVFNKYRQEICYGTPVSPDVSVDTLNSIYTRTVKLLNYLDVTFPSENWGQFLMQSGELDWTKIIVGGHSQGGGHAAYFGKVNNVDRVLMFSGPNDYSDFYNISANWLRANSQTDRNRYFAYLSLLDEVVPFEKQLVNIEGIGIYPLYDTTFVDVLNDPYNNSRCLYTTQDPGSFMNHSATVIQSDINREVWRYMLNSQIMTHTNDVEEPIQISVYPNPVISTLNVTSASELKNGNYKIISLNGRTVSTGTFLNPQSKYLDVSSLKTGCYILTIDGSSTMFFKS